MKPGPVPVFREVAGFLQAFFLLVCVWWDRDIGLDDNLLPETTNNLCAPPTIKEKKSVDANKMHDSHSLKVYRAACTQQQQQQH